MPAHMLCMLSYAEQPAELQDYRNSNLFGLFLDMPLPFFSQRLIILFDMFVQPSANGAYRIIFLDF